MINREVVAAFWASRASSGRLRWSSPDVLDFDIDNIVHAANNDPQSILDLGCGDGELLFKVLQHYPRASAVAVDSESSLGRHFAGRDNVEFRPRNVTEVEEFGAFDLILAFGLVTYLDASDSSALYRAISRSLSPGGIALIKHQVSLQQSLEVNAYSHELGAEYSSRYPNILEEQLLLETCFESVAVVEYSKVHNRHADTFHCLFVCALQRDLQN